MSDNDWLKYNSSEYTVNGITYRNLEAQVLKNKEDIEALEQSGGGGTPEVLWCTTSTTYAEITAALAAHQLPVLYVSMRIYTYYEDPTASTYRFVAVDPLYMVVRYYDVTTSDVWSASSKDISELEMHTTTVSLAAADWVSAGGGTYYAMNVACTGMTATAAMTYSAVPSQVYDMADYGIICTAQYADSLDFRTKGTDVPTGNITVNVVWWT